MCSTDKMLTVQSIHMFCTIRVFYTIRVWYVPYAYGMYHMRMVQFCVPYAYGTYDHTRMVRTIRV